MQSGDRGGTIFQQGHKNLLSPLDDTVVGKSQRSQWQPANLKAVAEELDSRAPAATSREAAVTGSSDRQQLQAAVTDSSCRLQ